MSPQGPGDLSRLCLHTITTRPWALSEAVRRYAAAGVAGITVWREALEGVAPSKSKKRAKFSALTKAEIEKAFSHVKFLWKTGIPIITDGEIVSHGNKRTLWVNVKVKENPQVERDVHDKFLKFYTVSEKNYEVTGKHFIPNPYVIEVDATK